MIEFIKLFFTDDLYFVTTITTIAFLATLIYAGYRILT
jgi:hypothetical protein